MIGPRSSNERLGGGNAARGKQGSHQGGASCQDARVIYRGAVGSHFCWRIIAKLLPWLNLVWKERTKLLSSGAEIATPPAYGGVWGLQLRLCRRAKMLEAIGNLFGPLTMTTELLNCSLSVLLHAQSAPKCSALVLKLLSDGT